MKIQGLIFGSECSAFDISSISHMFGTVKSKVVKLRSSVSSPIFFKARCLSYLPVSAARCVWFSSQSKTRPD